MSVLLIFFNAFIWSSSFALSKLAMESAAPLFVTGSRMLLAGSVLLGMTFYQRGRKCLSLSELGNILLLSFVGFYLANVCEFYGLLGLTSAKACFIYGLSPFVSALFSYLQLRERVTVKKIIGLSLGLLSYVVYLVAGERGCWSWSVGTPELLLLAATCLASYGWTLLRKIEKQSSLSVTAINAYAMLIAGLCSLGHSAVIEPWSPLPITNMSVFLQSILWIVLISNLVCYNLFAWLLRKFSSTFLSFCNLVMPLCTAFYGWLLLGESVSAGLFVAVALMVAGCRLIYHEEFRQGYIAS